MSEPASSRGVSSRRARLVAGVILVLVAAVVALVAMLAVSIMERRWEAQRPAMILQPIAEWEPDSAVWGANYPREYESYLRTRDDTTRTRYGGGVARDYLDEHPNQVILFAGYGFSKEYRQARGHAHARADVTSTKRLKRPFNAGTCWSCKSTDVPRLMSEMGNEQFYAANFHDLESKVTHSIGCQDCHDPKTMRLRITRPALREAFAARGQDVDRATHQEMRSLVCAQCHVEYYFKPEPRNYLTFPWASGFTVDDMIAYYDDLEFTDWVHPISKTSMIKAQHPDYELWTTGVHAYRGVACADCHMPYRTEGGLKFTDHHVQSPLLNIAGSCAVCHRWSEDEIRTRVESIQDSVSKARQRAEEALVPTHFDIAAAIQAGVEAEALELARSLLRHAQFRWDYVAANNGMGFHSPLESMRILGEATDEAQRARVAVARLIAMSGISAEPSYPNCSTFKKATAVAAAFEKGTPPRLFGD